MKSKKLIIGQIDSLMFREYDLKQVMDYQYHTKNIIDKNRGYAIVLVKIGQWTFAIPLRSYIPKKYQLKFKLRDSDKSGFVEGLDIGKSVIVEDEQKYIVSKNFRLRQQEDYYKIVDNDRLIINKLVKAILDFNKAIEMNDLNKLNDPHRFKFSTFINYVERLKQISEQDYVF